MAGSFRVWCKLSRMVAKSESPQVTIEHIDRELARRSFPDFLKFVKILEPTTPLKTGGIIPFEMWDYLVDFCEELVGKPDGNPDRPPDHPDNTGHLLLVILKSRQLGFSWILAAYALWTAQFKPAANVLMLSQGALESVVLLAKSRTIWENLPKYLQIPVGRDNDNTMEFPSEKSKITALPSTEKAGRSETATLVIQDEAEHHEYLDLNYAAIKPTIDAGGQFIQCSTVLKKRPASLFKEIFRNAPKNGFRALFYGWMCRPGRDKKWYNKRKSEAPTTAGMSPELYMEQEYPATAEEALRPSRVMAAFDQDALDDMQNDVKRPVETRHGVVNIYQRPRVGHRYAAASDTSHGVGKDYSVTVILDITGDAAYVVADVMSRDLEPELFAFYSVQLLKDYENPIWAIEDNEWGILTIKKAQDLRYPRLYEQRNKDGDLTGKVGHHTGGSNRSNVWGGLTEVVRDRAFIVPSSQGLAQFETCIRNSEKDGRIEGMVGTNDDYPMACAIAWHVRDEAYRGRAMKVKSTRWGDQKPRHTIGVANAAP